MTTTHKSGFAALIGRPNAGKSTLLNHLVGEHIAAVSSKPQTTRTRIQGIITRPDAQIIFVDTPGIHKPGYTLNRRMMGIVAEAMETVDVILLMRDVSAKTGAGERFTLEMIKNSTKPVILLLNKVDLIKNKTALLPMLEQFSQEHNYAEIIPISSRSGKGVEQLIELLIKYLPEGERLYDAEMFTDQVERNIAAELVREKILQLTGQELPFATAVQTELWTEVEGATEIHCVIYVERDSQKPIIIGKGGQMLKEIGTRARHDIEKMLGRHVRLNLFVRVQKQWRDDPRALDQLGIEEGSGLKGNPKPFINRTDVVDDKILVTPTVEVTAAIPAPKKVWHALEVEMSRAAEPAVTTQLWSANTTGIETSEDAPEQITFRAYFDAAPDTEKIKADILHALQLAHLPADSLHSIKAIIVADQDWLAEWKKGYEPVEIGAKILIAPSWKREQVAATERLIVQIDPGMAFGTGTHETTRGCLELLEKYWQGGSLLDVGTGTGILAMAAAKLFPGARIVGFDNDPEAIEVARENAEINGLTDEIELEVNRLSFFQGQEFDFVLANLTADVIIPLAPDFPKVISPQGTLIVSGILREQGDEVCAVLGTQNFEVIEARPDGEWVTFALKLKN